MTPEELKATEGALYAFFVIAILFAMMLNVK